MSHEQRCHERLIHADANSVARNPWLGHFQQDGPDLIAVADAYFVIRQAIDSQVLTKLPIGWKLSVEVVLPVTIRIGLIHHYRAVFAAVPYCIDLIGGARLETNPRFCKAFRPKS